MPLTNTQRNKRTMKTKRLLQMCDDNIAEQDLLIAKQYYKRMKACVICFHNYDKVGLENWTTKLKATARKYIDELETNCDTLKYTFIDGDKHNDLNNEGAYNKMCKLIKGEIEGIERYALYI